MICKVGKGKEKKTKIQQWRNTKRAATRIILMLVKSELLVVSQERRARTRMKIMEDEYVRKNREAKYYERKKLWGRERQIFRGEYRKNYSRKYRKAGMACGKKTRRIDSTITARDFSPVFTRE